MFFVFVQYLWPRLAPCFSGVSVLAQATEQVLRTVLGLSIATPAKMCAALTPTEAQRPESKSLLKSKWAEWDEEVGTVLELPCTPLLLLRQRHPGLSALEEQELYSRLEAKLLLEPRAFLAQRPNVPLCVGFEVALAQTFCTLAGIEACDVAVVRTVVKMLQLLHCCGYSWEVTLMTLAVALVYAESPRCRNRHGDCGSESAWVRKGVLEETLTPCNAILRDSCSTATNPTSQTYSSGGDESSAAQRSKLLSDRVVLLTFLAHCYLVDDPCFLCTWNTYVFPAPHERELESLNTELMHLFQARGYRLQAEAKAVLPLYARLEQAVRSHPSGHAYDLVGAANAPA